MPPIVALILCTLFVLWLLHQERKQSPDTTWVIWIPTIWVLSIASKPLGHWINLDIDYSRGSPLDQIFQSAMILIGLVIFLGNSTRRQGSIKDNLPILILIFYMLFSIFWSEMPYASFKAWVRQMPGIIMALIILNEENPWGALESIFRRTIYILIPFSFLLTKYYTFLGVDYGHWSGGLSWIGVTLHKNELGRLCLFAGFFLIWSQLKRWQDPDKSVRKYQIIIEIGILALSLYLMGGPDHSLFYSATANTAFAIGLLSLFGFYFIRKWNVNIRQTTLIAAATIIIIYGTITPFWGGLSIVDPSSVMGRGENLTGRTEIWATLLPYAMQKPILGYGYEGFWTPEIHEITSSHAHNGYLDIILNLGFIGLIFYYFFLLSCCRKACGLLIHNKHWGIFFLCIILMNLTYNIAETSFHVLANQLTAALIFLYVIAKPKLPNPITEENATTN